MNSINPSVVGEAAIVDALERVGFSKRRRGLMTFEMNPAVSGWVGLNRSTQGRPKGHVLFHPIVGVHHLELERQLAQAQLTVYKPLVSVTVSKPLEDLLPVGSHTVWITEEDSEVDAIVARQLASAAEHYAVPLFHSLSTLEQILEELEAMPLTSIDASYRIPVALWLLGRPEEALRRLEAEGKRIGVGPGPWQIQFSDYARRLEQVIRN